MTKQDIQPFSQDLKKWLKSGNAKNLSALLEVFKEKSFAILFLVLMALPALPIPTGGITHIVELIVMLACVQLIAGRQAVWLPHKWRSKDIGKFLEGKGTQKLIGFIAWFERFSRRRLAAILINRPVLSVLGLIVLFYTVVAFSAPPFSGLDTLPSMGVIIISLGLILEDALIVLFGIVVGAIGTGLAFAAGAALYSGFTHFF